MKVRSILFSLLALTLFCCAGCGYIHDRVSDITDCVRASVGVGPYGMVSARATLIGLGIGSEDTTRVGIEHKGAPTAWSESSVGILVLATRSSTGLKRASCSMALLTFEGQSSGVTETLGSVIKHFAGIDLVIPSPEFEDYFWIEAHASVVAGARVGFNILEFVDLLCGLTTLDILGDDTPVQDEEKEEKSKLW